MLENPSQRGMIRPGQLAARLSIGLSTLWLKVKTEPHFPRPVKLGKRITVFFTDEIDDYLRKLALASCGDALPGSVEQSPENAVMPRGRSARTSKSPLGGKND